MSGSRGTNDEQNVRPLILVMGVMLIPSVFVLAPAISPMMDGDISGATNATLCNLHSERVDYDRSYEVVNESEYVDELRSEGENMSAVTFFWGNYDGPAPTGYRLFGGEEVSRGGFGGVSATSEGWLDPKTTGTYELVLVKKETGMFRSTEHQVLERVDVNVTVNKTVHTVSRCSSRSG